ncbi:MAG: M20/M25/M40 family metallo-hydrolase [Clostridia bacterium]|nr:M20/M25/M40 family metallo-hydrolase [Clostridia bacterium]
MEMFEILCALCHSNGTSGDETAAAQVASQMLEKYMPVHCDAMGNVIGDTEIAGSKILLDAHIDRIGFAVTAIDDKGFIKVARVGGIDPIVLSAAEVTVHGKQEVYGVIASTPPHLASKEEKKAQQIDELALDVGMTKEEAEKIISVGDRITMNGDLQRLLTNRVSGAALDDRCGVAAILRCLEILGDKLNELPIRVMFSSCEETGSAGAVAGGFSAGADEAIAVDVSFAKAPGTDDSIKAKLGEGTMIGYAPSLNFEMSRRLEKLAKEKGIKYQIEVMGSRTGTNADDIAVSAGGKKTALLSVPQRNMHTAVEIIDLDDIESTAQLMAAYILSREGANNA